MRQLSILGVLLGLSTLAPPAGAGAVPETAFQPLDRLAGGCYRGTFPDGRSTDEHCWEWVWEGKFLRDRHVVRGPQPDYEGETIYGWDSGTGQLRFWYFTNAGFYATGVMRPDGERAVFPETVVEGGRRREIESVTTFPADGVYRVESREKVDGAWKELWTMELKRVPDGPGEGSPAQLAPPPSSD